MSLIHHNRLLNITIAELLNIGNNVISVLKNEKSIITIYTDNLQVPIIQQ